MGDVDHEPHVAQEAPQQSISSPSISVCVIGPRTSPLVATTNRLEAAGAVQQLLVLEVSREKAHITTADRSGDCRAKVLMPELGPVEGRADALWRTQSHLTGDIVCVIEQPLLQDVPASAIQAVLARSQLYPLVIAGPSVAEADANPHWLRLLTEITIRPTLAAYFPELVARVPAPLSGLYAIRRDLLGSLPFTTGNLPSLSLLLSVYLARGVATLSYLSADLPAVATPPTPVEELANEALRIALGSLELHGKIDTSDVVDRRIAMPKADGTLVTGRYLGMSERPPFVTRRLR
jgi:glucosyl-3-phosphoglycerate synthase